MALEDIDAMKKFLKPFPAEVVDRALWLRKFIWENFPGTNE